MHDAMGGASVVRDIFVLLILSMLIALFSFLFCLLQENIESYAIETTMGAGRFSVAVQKILRKEQEKKVKKQHRSVPSIRKIVIKSPTKPETKSPDRRVSNFLNSVCELEPEDSFICPTTYYDEPCHSFANPVAGGGETVAGGRETEAGGGESVIGVGEAVAGGGESVLTGSEYCHSTVLDSVDNVIVIDPRISKTTDNQILNPLPTDFSKDVSNTVLTLPNARSDEVLIVDFILEKPKASEDAKLSNQVNSLHNFDSPTDLHAPENGLALHIEDVDGISNSNLKDDIKDALDDREVCKMLGEVRQDNQQTSNHIPNDSLIIDISKEDFNEDEMVEIMV